MTWKPLHIYQCALCYRFIVDFRHKAKEVYSVSLACNLPVMSLCLPNLHILKVNIYMNYVKGGAV